LSGPASGPERGLWTPERSAFKLLRRPVRDGTDGSDGSEVLAATVTLTAVARIDT
jgi:hypothetical protein